MTDDTLVCLQCGDEFALKESEIDRYERMDFDLPQRCPACRRQKHKAAKEPDPRRQQLKKRDYHRKYEAAEW